jgi:ubiquinone/menaquinone biosynthesis C-methylase UbiE
VVIHRAASEGFSRNAADYERSRPGYPPAAVAHLITALGLRPGTTVVDVAAGTGKLTRLLTPSGARVIGVEPVGEMRDQLQRTTEGVEVVDATVERLPLDDASADAVTVAQAFHWFDGPAALAELSRVLRPAGGLAVVYNQRDRTAPWLAEVNALVEAHRHGVPQQWDGAWREAFETTTLFTPLEETEFDNPQELGPDEFITRLRSMSYVGALAPEEQQRLFGAVAAVLASRPDTAGRTTLVIPQRTVVSICRRR